VSRRSPRHQTRRSRPGRLKKFSGGGQGGEVDVVGAVPRGIDDVGFEGIDVGTDVSGTVEVGGDEVDGGFVDVVEVEERSVDGVESGPPVGTVVAGSVVDVVRGTVVRGTTTSTDPEDDGVAGRTSRNSASVTTKIAPSITVDLRARPNISWRPAPHWWSPDRARG
jgi:hypothetical protein